MRSRRSILVPSLILAIAAVVGAQPASQGGINSIQPDALKEWLTYIASDELQGRQIYTEGLGLAARLHRRSPEGVGRQAWRRQRELLPDRQGAWA